jgi:hypothetical protein
MKSLLLTLSHTVNAWPGSLPVRSSLKLTGPSTCLAYLTLVTETCRTELVPMPESQDDILRELDSIFAWSPIAHTFVSPHESDRSDDDNSSREVAFYDMHLAPNRICKRVVHIKNLHRKVAQTVDKKLQAIRDSAISFQPPTTPEFYSKARLDRRLGSVTLGDPMANRRSIAEYYLTITSQFCMPIASSLVLHPKYWSTLIGWSMSPRHERLGGSAPSLHIVPVDNLKEQFVPEHVAIETFEQLKKIRAESNDLATWEIRGLTVEDTDDMLGVLTMASALAEGEFQWRLCSGLPCTSVDDSIPKMLCTARACDAPEILSLVEEPCIDPEPSTNETMCNSESSLNDSLRRGGSSIQSVLEDIYLKQSEPYVEWEWELEPERAARKASKARAIEEMSWTPPDGGHTPSQELIQKVCEPYDIFLTFLTSTLNLRRGANQCAKIQLCSFYMLAIMNMFAFATARPKHSIYQIFCTFRF